MEILNYSLDTQWLIFGLIWILFLFAKDFNRMCIAIRGEEECVTKPKNDLTCPHCRVSTKTKIGTCTHCGAPL